jgi:GTP pyrophosphokinase
VKSWFSRLCAFKWANLHRYVERAREWLTDALVADPGLMTLVGGPAGVCVKARRKSLFSTMRKVLR